MRIVPTSSNLLLDLLIVVGSLSGSMTAYGSKIKLKIVEVDLTL